MFKRDNSFFWKTLTLVCILLLAFNFIKFKSRQNTLDILSQSASIDRFSYGKLSLFLREGQWYVEDSGIAEPANKESVDNFIKKLKEISLKNPLSLNKSNFQKYGITTDSPILSVDNAKYSIGSLSQNLENTYIQPVDQKGVYEIPVYWGSGGPSELSYWHNRMIVNLPMLQIVKVVLDNEKIIEPKEGSWEKPDWIRKITYLVGGKYLGVQRPEGKALIYKIYYSDQVHELVFSQKWVKNGDHYYELDPKDYLLLTSGGV